jgi:hypothetical protein
MNLNKKLLTIHLRPVTLYTAILLCVLLCFGALSTIVLSYLSTAPGYITETIIYCCILNATAMAGASVHDAKKESSRHRIFGLITTILSYIGIVLFVITAAIQLSSNHSIGFALHMISGVVLLISIFLGVLCSTLGYMQHKVRSLRWLSIACIILTTCAFLATIAGLSLGNMYLQLGSIITAGIALLCLALLPLTQQLLYVQKQIRSGHKN